MMTGDQPVPSEQEHENEYRTAQFDQSMNALDQPGNTSKSTWLVVFGSSTVFHVLLLILLGMIILSQPEDEQEVVTLQIPEEEEDQPGLVSMIIR